jgi:hypothetical protein
MLKNGQTYHLEKASNGSLYQMNENDYIQFIFSYTYVFVLPFLLVRKGV